MENKCQRLKHKLFFPVIFSLVFFGTAWLIPWDRVNWGKFEILPGSSLTVTGEAKEQLKSQIAHFTVSFTATDDDKQAAVNEVNQKMTAIIKAIKDFGIDAKDIQTQNVSVYQQEEDEPRALTYPPQPVRDISSADQWRASNSVSLVLRDVDKASQLTDLLQSLEATSVSGPRFSLDDTKDAQAELLKSAIDDAREKAEVIAKASGRKLGKVLTVDEGGTAKSSPVYRALEAADANQPAPVEPGSETVYKTVTVTFELK